MLITIYDKAGNPKADLSPNDSSTQVKEVQGDSVLSLSFTHYEHIELDVDDYADFLGERFWLTEKYRPRQNSGKEWVYDLKLYGVESMLKRLLVIKTVDNEEEPVFTLTAPPREHVAMIVKCMNAGMGNVSDWKVGQVDGTENIVIDYFGKYCDEALREIAEKTGTEWWVDGQTVNVCRCEHGEPVELGYGKGLLSIDSGTADNVKFYTRLYPVGSSRNIDREKYGFTRLQLPGGRKYVEMNADKYGRVDHYEADAFADIYPRRTGTVSGVRSEVRTGEDGKPFTIYYFTDSSLPFDPNEYMIGGLVIRVSFQEGSELAGLGEEDDGTYFFEVNFNSTTREFEIITIWPYDNDMQLPGDKLVPKAGDKYILWNLRMPDEYYTLAEEEFLAAVNKYNADHNLDISVYKAPTDHVWIEENDVDLSVGRRVRLESEEYYPGTGYRDSRITRITRRVNLPSQMDLEIGDAVGRTAMSRMNDSIESVRSYARTMAESVSLPDIIRTGDRTRATDNNLLSALRSYRDLLRKDRDDRSAHRIASDMGFEIGNYLAGVSGGMLGIDSTDGQSFADVFKLWVRGKAYFETLAIIEAETLGGRQYITPGGSVKCTKTEDVKDASGKVTAYRCYFLSEQDGEKTDTKIVTGDQAISEMFNARPGTANKVTNHRWWRLVTGVSNDAYTDDSGNHYGYIDLSPTDCETNSDIPKEGDVIAQFGNRTDRTRQGAVMLDTVGPDAPSIKLLAGINGYTLAGKDIITQGYDHVKGHAYMNVYGDTYIGDKEGNAYVKYDQDTKQVDIKAKLHIGTTVGGKDLESWLADHGYIDDTALNTFIAGYQTTIEGLRDQIDGKIDTWFYAYDPTLANKPASDWTTDADKSAHAGDLFYNTATKKVFRWTGAAWEPMTDPDIQAALDAASDAQDTADNKRRVFMATPTVPYDEGDLWIDTTADGKTLKVCVKSRATEAFTESEWTVADDASLNAFATLIDNTLTGLRDQLDQKAETWYQATDPSVSWDTPDKRALHKGDLWYCTADIAGTDFKKGTTWYWNGTAWEKQDVPQSVFDTIDGKADIFVSKPTSYHKNDLWFLEAAYTLSGTAYKAGTLVVAKNDMKPTGWDANDWTKKDRYTDDTLAQQAKDAADAAQDTADNAQADADAAKNRLDQWAADGVVSPTEKQGVKDEIARIDADKAHIAAEYTRYGLGTPTAYNNAHATYRTQLVALSAATPENIPIPLSFAANQTAYYNARTTALSAIAAAAKKYAEDIAKQEAQNAVASYEYLKNALAQDTVVQGGLIMSTLVSLGYTDGANTRHTLAGMNGQRSSKLGDRSIASWWGGEMVDLYNTDGTKKTTLTGKEATSLARMDGSAYFANGNVGFRTDGGGWLAGNNITWDATGAITFGNGITIDLGGGKNTTLGGLQTSLASVDLLLNKLANLFTPYLGNKQKNWGDINTNADFDNIRINAGAWTQSFLSAKGASSSGGSGAGKSYLSELLDVQIGTPQNGQALVYREGKWVNTAVMSQDMSGYALQSWVQSNYVTLATAQTISGRKSFSSNVVLKGIEYQGTKGTYTMISFIDNTIDGYGNGIAIGGGGTTIIGGGESAATLKATISNGGGENLILCNDEYIDIYTNCQNGLSSAVHTTIKGDLFSGVAANANSLGGKAAAQYVTTDTQQTIAGAKTFARDAATVMHVENTGVTSTSKYALINFKHTGNNISGIAANKDNNMLYRTDAAFSSAYMLLDTGNYASILDGRYYTESEINAKLNSYLTTASASSTYVKKSGDTMTGLLHINANGTTFDIGGQNSVYVHLYSSVPCYFNKDIYTAGSNIYAGGGSYRVWHTGNDGSGSGLDADLLDGNHATSFLRKVTVANNAVNDFNTFESMTLTGRGDPSTGASLINAPWTGAGPAGGYGVLTYLWSGGYGMQLACGYHANRLYIRNKYYNNNSAIWDTTWSSIALLTDNVASATKLQTARTIWGQSFNGTGNVSGNMTGVGTIYCQGTSNSYREGLRIKPYGSWATILLGGDDLTADSGTSTNSWGIFNNNGNFYINKNSSNGAQGARAWGSSTGWTFGNTSTNTCALNCASFICDSWVRTKGNTGWYNETYGGGWAMSDTTWVRMYNGKSLYVDTGQIRCDNQFNRMGYGGASWNNGYGAYNVAVVSSSAQTPLMVAYRLGQTAAVTGADRLFAMELLNNGTQLNFAFGGAMKFRMESAGRFYVPGSIKIGECTISYDTASGMLKFDKGIYSTGAVSAKGANSSGGSSGGGKNYLSELLDVNLGTMTNANAGQFLKWNGTRWVNAAITSPSMAGYALESWVAANYQPKGSYLAATGTNATAATLPNLVKKIAYNQDDFPYGNDYIIVCNSLDDYEACSKIEFASVWMYVVDMMNKSGGYNIGTLASPLGAIYANGVSSGKGSTVFKIACGGSANQLNLYSNGSVGLGTTAQSTYRLDVNGTGRFTGNLACLKLTQTSDVRFKTNARALELPLESLADAPIFRFNWKASGESDYGTSAQYWQSVDNALVDMSLGGILGIDYGKIALAGLKTVAGRVLDHEGRIAELERENKELKRQLSELKAA